MAYTKLTFVQAHQIIEWIRANHNEESQHERLDVIADRATLATGVKVSGGTLQNIAVQIGKPFAVKRKRDPKVTSQSLSERVQALEEMVAKLVADLQGKPVQLTLN